MIKHIRAGRTYTVANSSLVVKVLNVIDFEAKEYAKIKTMLFNKSGQLLERAKYYKVDKINIAHWKQCSDKGVIL